MAKKIKEKIKLEDRDDRFIQVEYDLDFHGGNYGKVGDFVLLSFREINKHGSVEAAFEAKTGHQREHMIHYCLDEVYDKDGEEAQD